MATKQSKEVKIQREVEKWLTSYDMEFVTQNESVNPEIDKALSKAPSKTGGEGQISGVLHSASLYMGDEKLLKVKVGDFLIKIFSHDDEITKIGERVFLKFEDGSMLALE